MPGAQCTRSLVCEVVVQDAHEYSQRSHRKSPGIPARNGFTAYVALSPAIGLSCHRRLRKLLPANLTPASRRQDHTILPSASALFVKSALASTASRPASVTIASRPSVGRDDAHIELIWSFGKPEYFFERGWTGRRAANEVICPSGHQSIWIEIVPMSQHAASGTNRIIRSVRRCPFFGGRPEVTCARSK